MRHLQRANPQLNGIRLGLAAAQSFTCYVRYWLESFRLPHLTTSQVNRGIITSGFEHIQDALAAGKGAIVALPHLGGWEWAGRWLVGQGHGLTVVVERIEPPRLFAWFVALREKLGMKVVALGPDAGREVLAALGRNEVVCLLCDRDLPRSGVSVEFFGEQTTIPAGPATLALRTSAALLPAAIYFDGRGAGHLGVVRPPISTERSGDGLRADVNRVSQVLAAELELLIRRAPSQWHMFQPNWPSDPGY